MTTEVTTKRKPGRPRKSEIEKAKKPGKVGRPPGQAARIAEFKARLVVTDGPKVIAKIIEKALKDGDPDQWAALKFCGDRLIPISMFEDKSNQGKPLVEITVNKADPNAGIHAQQRLEQRRAALVEQSLTLDGGVTVQGHTDED